MELARDPNHPDLCLQSSWDFRCEASYQACIFLFKVKYLHGKRVHMGFIVKKL
jgi:hypothetical protein